MSEQEKKWQRIYDLLNTETKPKKISEIICVSLWPPSSPDRNPLDYAIWGVLENKMNATSHPNIGLLKTVIEKEWNKMSKEFILQTCKSFQRRLDKIIEKMVSILYKFTDLCLSSYFVVYNRKLKLILFCNRVVGYYTRIFLILLLHPVISFSKCWMRFLTDDFYLLIIPNAVPCLVQEFQYYMKKEFHMLCFFPVPWFEEADLAALIFVFALSQMIMP